MKLLALSDVYDGMQANVLAVGRQQIAVSAVDASTLPAPTWASVLVAGASNGGITPNLDGDGRLNADTSLALSVGGVARSLLSPTYLEWWVPSVRWNETVVSPTLGQRPTNLFGQTLTILAQEGDAGGGWLLLQAGASLATGGDLKLRAGLGSVANGAIVIEYPGGDPAILVSTTETTIGDNAGIPAIRVTSSGVGFFDGTPVERPSIVGSTAGNVALQNLLTALDSMGLITDDTT